MRVRHEKLSTPLKCFHGGKHTPDKELSHRKRNSWELHRNRTDLTDTSKALEPLMKSAVGKEQAGIVGKLTTIIFALDSILGILGYKVVKDLPSFFAVSGSIAGVTAGIIAVIILVAVKMPLQSVEGAALADLEKAKLALGTKNMPDAEQISDESISKKLATIPEKPEKIEVDEEEESESVDRAKPKTGEGDKDPDGADDVADAEDVSEDDKQQNEG